MKLENFRLTVQRDSPEILLALGLVSTTTTVICAVKDTARAGDVLKQENADWKEKIRTLWPYYIPTALSFGLSVGSLLMLYSVFSTRNQISGGLYLTALEGLREYQNQLRSALGEKEFENVNEKIAAAKLESHPLPVVVQGGGDVLFYDSYSGRYFLSTMETIKGAVNTFNHELLTEMFKSLNEFYYILGLEGIEAGHGMGWGVDKLLDVHFNAQIVNAPKTQWDKQPCIVLSYDVLPDYLAM